MNSLLEIVVSNCVVALALAVVVAGISRLRVNPNVVHVLWLMVLVKFFTPPLWQVDLSWPNRAAEPEVEEVVIAGETRIFLSAESSQVPVAPPENVPAPEANWPRILFAIWALGVAGVFTITMMRVLCFRSLLRRAKPAPSELIELAEELCKRLGVRHCPEVLLLPVRISPAVWSLSGRPRILLPAELIQEMQPEQLETILAHELAHIRRGDHLVRLLELAVTTAFWCNPVVWWVRRNLREMEEHCCDALVLETLPDSARRYAIALIETVEFLSNQSGRLPIGATAAKPTVTLTRRIQMLKHGHHVRRLSAKSLVALFAVLIVPMTLAFGQDDSKTTELKTKIYRLKDLDAKAVEKTIIEKVAPKDWAKAGGPHTIKQTGKGLVITASLEVHQQISLVLELQRLIERQTDLEQKLQAYNADGSGDVRQTQTKSVPSVGYDLLLHGLLRSADGSDVLSLHDLYTGKTLSSHSIIVANCQKCHQADAHWYDLKQKGHPQLPGKESIGKSLDDWKIELYQSAPRQNEEAAPKKQEGQGEAAAALRKQAAYALLLRRAYMNVYGVPSPNDDAKLEIWLREVSPKDAQLILEGTKEDGGAGREGAADAKARDFEKKARRKTPVELELKIIDGDGLSIELDDSKSRKPDTDKK